MLNIRQIKKSSKTIHLAANNLIFKHSNHYDCRVKLPTCSNIITREYSEKKETTPVSTSEEAKLRAERRKVMDDGSFLSLFRLAKQNIVMIKKHLSVGEIIMLLLLGIPGVGVLYKYFYELPSENT